MRVDRWVKALVMGAVVGSLCWAWDQRAFASQVAFDEEQSRARASESAAARASSLESGAALAAELADLAGPTQWKAIESVYEEAVGARLEIKVLTNGDVPRGPTAGGGFQRQPTIEAITFDLRPAAAPHNPLPDRSGLPLAAGALAAACVLATRRRPFAVGFLTAAIAAAAWSAPSAQVGSKVIQASNRAPLALILGAAIDWPRLPKPADALILAALGSELSRDYGAVSLHGTGGAQIAVAGGSERWAYGAKAAPALAMALATGRPASSSAECGFISVECEAWATPVAGGALVAYDRPVRIEGAGGAVNQRPSMDRLGLTALLLMLAALFAWPMSRRSRSPNGAPASVD
jgi:hypothetical protein